VGRRCTALTAGSCSLFLFLGCWGYLCLQAVRGYLPLCHEKRGCMQQRQHLVPRRAHSFLLLYCSIHSRSSSTHVSPRFCEALLDCTTRVLVKGLERRNRNSSTSPKVTLLLPQGFLSIQVLSKVQAEVERRNRNSSTSPGSHFYCHKGFSAFKCYLGTGRGVASDNANGGEGQRVGEVLAASVAHAVQGLAPCEAKEGRAA